MKRILVFLVAVGFMLTANGANIFTISTVEGHPGEEVTVSVSLTTDGTAVVGEMLIPLDKQLKYVAESCVPGAGYADDYEFSAALVDEGLRVVVYSVALTPLKGDGSEFFSFKVKLGKDPATYAMSGTPILGDEAGNRLTAEVTAGSVTILSPELTVITTSTDYGHIPIRSTYTRNITLQNTGNETLEISDVEFSASEFSVSETAFSVEPGATKDVVINYAPVVRGAISEKVTFVSNAINGKQSATLIADPFSVNELHVGSASGISDEEVTISLTMNNMEPIVGVQCEFALPDELVYVDGSFCVAERSASHSAESVYSDRRLTLMMYSGANEAMADEDGVIATFRVRLNGRNGWYGLSPENVLLSNITAENMTSATSGGSVEIKSPTFEGNSTLDMGSNPVTEMTTAKYSIYNSGQVDLVISKVAFLAEGYTIAEELPISVEPWQSTEITVQYAPTVKGKHSTLMNIYTNDPQNRVKQVEVSGNVYEPNSLELSGEYTEKGYDLCVSLNNYSEVVAMQMDVHWLNGMNVPSDGIKLSSRLNGLSSSVSKMGDGVYRVVIFSLNNTPISGNEGEIFTLSYVNEGAENIDNSVIRIDDLVFSTDKSENVSSQTEFTYTVPSRLAQSIALDKTEVTLKATETATLSVTVLPESATVKDVVWSSSDETVASVKDGVVTAHKVGEATITATTTDGSNLSATCKVTVEATQAQSIEISKPEKTTLLVGENIQLEAVVYPETATDKSVTWSSSKKNVAIVDKNGMVTAVGIGSVTIKATSSNGDTDAVKFTVNPVLVESLELDITTISGTVGDVFTITANIKPLNATITELEWSVDDEDIAKLKSEGNIAIVEILKPGSTTIKVKTTDGSELSATCTINAVSSITEIVNDSDVETQYYTLSGILVAKENLTQGVYIKKTGNKSTKIIIH